MDSIPQGDWRATGQIDGEGIVNVQDRPMRLPNSQPAAPELFKVEDVISPPELYFELIAHLV